MKKYKYEMVTTEHKCIVCGGRKWTTDFQGFITGSCRDCNGTGVLSITKKQRVYIGEVKNA